MNRKRRRSWPWLLALVVAWPLVSGAADPAPKSWHYEVWNELMSPYCPGRTLLDCTSSQAADLRGWIAEQEKSGRSREEVESQLYQEFGDVVLQAPKASGFGLAAYVIPVVAFLAGGVFVVAFMRRQGAAASAPSPVPVAVSDPDVERLIDDEMRRG